ncbi:MAG: amino acid permease [Alphaproteobacteria bacterium]|nr:amino acid permease [Alphaproteobacteria bacterium]
MSQQSGAASGQAGGTFRQELGWFSLFTMSLGTVIGSGWLLLPAVAASHAGVASIASWIVGGVAVLIVAVVYAELGAAWPAAGAVALYPRLSHGSFTGHVAGWAAFISYAIIPPAEAVAVTRYAGSFVPAFVTPDRTLTVLGLIVAIAILAIISALNYVGVRYLAHFQNWITSLKFIPILLFLVGAGFFAFHGANFTSFGPFAPNGGSGIMLGVASTIFAYIGFRQALDFGAEAKKPGRDLPLAVILTVVVSLVTYVLIAIVFLGALNWSGLAQYGVKAGDWSTLAKLPAPLYNVAAAAGLGVIAWLIFIDGVVSPNGPNATNVGSVPRVAYTIAENGTLPRFFLQLNPRYGTPGWGLFACFLLEVFFLLMTTGGYSALISAVNVAFMVGYAIGPVSFGVLRQTAPDHPRPFRLPFGEFWAPLAFVLSSLILYWSGWPDTGETLAALLVGVVIYYFYLWRGTAGRDTLRFGAWLVVYLIAMAVLSYLGDRAFGGIGALPGGWDLVAVVFISLAIYYWGVRQGVAFAAVRESLAPSNRAAAH